MKTYQEYQGFFLIKTVLDLTQGIMIDPVPKSFESNSSSWRERHCVSPSLRSDHSFVLPKILL